MNKISFPLEWRWATLPRAPRRALLALERLAEYRDISIVVNDLKSKHGLWRITCHVPDLDAYSDLDIYCEEIFEYLANTKPPLPLCKEQIDDVEWLIEQLDVEIEYFRSAE